MNYAYLEVSRDSWRRCLKRQKYMLQKNQERTWVGLGRLRHPAVLQLAIGSLQMGIFSLQSKRVPRHCHRHTYRVRSGAIVSSHGEASSWVLTPDTFNCGRLVIVTWCVPETRSTDVVASRATVYNYS